MVTIGEGWVEQKLKSLTAGLPNESKTLQDQHLKFDCVDQLIPAINKLRLTIDQNMQVMVTKKEKG